MAKVLATKKTERAGVNEFRALLESAGHIVQEIDGGNDYGEDCYLSLTYQGQRTGDVIAVQVKSGMKYRRAFGYGIPCRHHIEDWTRSRIPVVGVVYDPEIRKLYWVNLTGYLLESLSHGKRPKSVPLAEDAILDFSTLPNFIQEMRAFAARNDILCEHHLSWYQRLASATRSYRNRDANSIEEMPIGGHRLPGAGWVDFEERHPNLLNRVVLFLSMISIGVFMAMMGPGLYQASGKEFNSGIQRPWVWLIIFYGLVWFLLRLAKHDPNKTRRRVLTNVTWWVIVTPGWFIALKEYDTTLPLNSKFAFWYIVMLPVIAKSVFLYVGSRYIALEVGRRRRLRMAYNSDLKVETNKSSASQRA